MRSAYAMVAAGALASCSFDPSTMATAFDGDGSPIRNDGASGDGSTAVGDAGRADADPPCMLPFLIDDHFENNNLEIAGAMSTGSGFTAERNTSSGNGASAEIGGALLDIRTSSNATGAAPAFGAASNNSFPFDSANGMTIRLEVANADTPIWNGIVLGLQSNQGSTDSAGGSLMLRLRGSVPRAFTIGMGTNQVNDAPVSEMPYDEAELEDGFTITWELQADSWAYVAEGLLTSGDAITDSGAYGVGETPADLLDATAHVGVHIQGTTGDPEQRVLQVRRLAVMTGVCP